MFVSSMEIIFGYVRRCKHKTFAWSNITKTLFLRPEKKNLFSISNIWWWFLAGSIIQMHVFPTVTLVWVWVEIEGKCANDACDVLENFSARNWYCKKIFYFMCGYGYKVMGWIKFFDWAILFLQHFLVLYWCC